MQCCDDGPQSWGDKVITETPVRTYVLPQALRDAGFTIQGITSVAATVWKFSEVPDPAPAGVLANANQINPAPFVTDEGVSVGAAQAVFVKFAAAGVEGATYRIRHTLVLAPTGETFVEDVLQKITDTVPATC